MYIKKAFYLIVLLPLLWACNKSDDSSDDSAMQDFGALTFYHNDPFPCNTISISITNPDGDESNGTLSGAAVVSGIPDCDVPDTFTFLNLPYAVYQFTYICGERTINGQISVNKECFAIQMIN